MRVWLTMALAVLNIALFYVGRVALMKRSKTRKERREYRAYGTVFFVFTNMFSLVIGILI